MHVLVPLAVAVPLLAAAAIAAANQRMRPGVDDGVAIAAAAATAALCMLLVLRTGNRPVDVFFGGWRPRGGVALGIAFSVEPLSASLAALAAVLTAAALVFAWRSFADAGSLFHVLMLVFLAGMVAFALAGDLFTMFVFFELMGVAAFALTAYRSDSPGPLQGALNFAVTNSIAAFLILTGIGLLYGRTGALNLAQVGEALAHRRSDGLVVVAFCLLVVGFLVKAGVVPFHFWLSDAYAVAPIPVCVLLSGAMSDLGIHGIARVYWDVFSGPLAPHAEAVRLTLVVLGVASALVGAAMSFLEAGLKRMLAFVTISNAGVFLAGTALLTPRAFAGTSISVVAQGCLRGAIFLVLGTVVHRLERGDELTLHGRARPYVVTGAVFGLAVLGLAGLPPFGPFLGSALVTDAARRLGDGWLPPLVAAAVALSSASLLRAGGRVFLGLGTRDDPLLTRAQEEASAEEPETPVSGRPPLALTPAGALVAVGLALGVVPAVATHARVAAARFENRPAYAAEVLHGRKPAPAPRLEGYRPPAAGWAYGATSTAGALALAALGLYRPRLPLGLRRVAGRALGPPVAVLRTVHSGVVGDYVTWLAFGAAALGGIFVLTLR